MLKTAPIIAYDPQSGDVVSRFENMSVLLKIKPEIDEYWLSHAIYSKTPYQGFLWRFEGTIYSNQNYFLRHNPFGSFVMLEFGKFIGVFDHIAAVIPVLDMEVTSYREIYQNLEFHQKHYPKHERMFCYGHQLIPLRKWEG